MKVAFLQLSIQGFKSFRDRVEIDLGRERPLGLHYVCGENQVDAGLGANGSGKTTIWDAFCWCLTGKTPSGLRNTDIVPWNWKGKTVVEIELEVDGEPHTITRTVGPNRFLIDATEAASAFDLMGMDYALLTHTVLLAQEQPLFYDLQPRDKMALFGAVLNLDRWDERSVAASARALNIERDLTDCLTLCARKESVVEVTTRNLTDARKASDEWDAERSNQVKETTAKIAELLKQHKKLDRLVNDAALKLDSAGLELKNAKAKRAEARDAYSEADVAHRTAREKLDAYAREATALYDELGELAEGGNCPTCGQALKGTALDRHRVETKKKIESLRKASKGAVPLKIREALAEAKEELAFWDEQEREWEEKVGKLEAEYDFHSPRLVELDVTLSALEREREKLEEGINPHRGALSTARKALTAAKDDLDKLQAQRDDLEALLDNTKFWIKGFKDIRLNIIKDTLAELELSTNSMLEEVGLTGWSVMYDVERETKSGSISRGLSVLIASPSHKEMVKWESWSGGERQRLRLIGALALSDVLLSYAGVEVNIQILDEPTSHLSAEGVKDLPGLLSDRAALHNKHVWYTDHMAVESSRFASVTRVVKTAEGSILK